MKIQEYYFDFTKLLAKVKKPEEITVVDCDKIKSSKTQQNVVRLFKVQLQVQHYLNIMNRKLFLEIGQPETADPKILIWGATPKTLQF